MRSRVDCYIDIASLYSYYGFILLLKDEDILAAHGVDVEFHPVLLGGINTKTGNKPPWMLPAKGKYLNFDVRRSAERVGKPEIRGPKDLMAMALTTLPNRALHYIKQTYPKETFERAIHYFFHCFWTPPNQNLGKSDVLADVLAKMPADFNGAGSYQGSKMLFASDEVKQIMAAAQTQEFKDRLARSTQEALDKGAFGAPWLWARNAAGVEEPFFGSDRFHFLYKFLDVPFQDIAILPPSSPSGEKTSSKL